MRQAQPVPASLLYLAFASLLLAACSKPGAPVIPGSGATIYMERCAVCHADNRKGRPGMYPPLTGSPWVTGPPERLTAIILDGMQGPSGQFNAVMPGWGSTLRDAEIAELITWLRYREGRGPYTAVDVNHVRIETGGRNTFWTAGELHALRVR